MQHSVGMWHRSPNMQYLWLRVREVTMELVCGVRQAAPARLQPQMRASFHEVRRAARFSAASDAMSDNLVHSRFSFFSCPFVDVFRATCELLCMEGGACPVVACARGSDCDAWWRPKQ